MDSLRSRTTVEDAKAQVMQHKKALTKLTAYSFGLLISCSISFGLAYFYLWNKLRDLKELTNVFSAYFGFMTCTMINLVASIFGLLSLHEKKAQDETNDQSHSNAVILLLISGIIFNIIFPTTALLPLEIDSKSRIPTTPLSTCSEESSKTNNYPECLDAKVVEVSLYCMYLLIVIELIGLIFYGYVWRQRNEMEQNLIISINRIVRNDISSVSDDQYLPQIENIVVGNQENNSTETRSDFPRKTTGDVVAFDNAEDFSDLY